MTQGAATKDGSLERDRALHPSAFSVMAETPLDEGALIALWRVGANLGSSKSI